MPDSRPEPEAADVPRPVRRHDPDRRNRIIDACLDVIAEVGVAGVSHRKVAAAADVPLGSMTYHFDGMDQLLHEAFSRFAQEFSDRFRVRMTAARTPEQARLVVAEQMLRESLRDQRELILTQELYTLAARVPRYRTITNAWMAASRAALELHFDPVTARLLDASVEGLSLHRALDTEPQDPAVVHAAIDRILSGGNPT